MTSLHESLSLQVVRHEHDDGLAADSIQPLLKQQRHIQHNIACALHEKQSQRLTRELRPDGTAHERIQPPPRARISEDELTQRLPVECAVRPQNARTECERECT